MFVDARQTWLSNPKRNLSPIYAMAELIWYLSGEAAITRIVPYAPQYEKFANEGIAYGAYGARMKYLDNGNQLFEVIEFLKTNPETRQAVVQLWDKEDLRLGQTGKINDLPCTLSWQFLIRDDELNMTTTMRSNDLWLGFPYDCFVNSCIQQIIANELNLDVGTYVHNVCSMHIYEKDLQKIADCVSYAEESPLLEWVSEKNVRLLDSIEGACDNEEQARLNNTPPGLLSNYLLSDACATVARKWEVDSEFISAEWELIVNAYCRRARSNR